VRDVFDVRLFMFRKVTVDFELLATDGAVEWHVVGMDFHVGGERTFKPEAFATRIAFVLFRFCVDDLMDFEIGFSVECGPTDGACE